MSKKAFEKLEDLLCQEIEQYGRKSQLSSGDLEVLHKLSDTLKNFKKICLLDEQMDDGDGEYSERGRYSRGRGGNSYGNGSSYANRGEHWVRGHYSRDGGREGRYRDGDGMYSGRRGEGRRRDSRGRYSRDDGREHMISQMEEIMEDIKDPKIHEAAAAFIEEIEEM